MIRACWRCDCTDMAACPGGCSWVAPFLCSACEVTPATPAALGWRMTPTAHLQGPRKRPNDITSPQIWFGDIVTCIQEPRLRKMTRCFREGRRVEITWIVDGKALEGEPLGCALCRLNAPPVLTEAEVLVLAGAPRDWEDRRKTSDFQTLMALSDKGLVEFHAGRCRRRVTTSAKALTQNGALISP